MRLTLNGLLDEQAESLSEPQQRFQQLWQQLQACQQDFAGFEADMEAMVKQYQQEIIPLEKEVVPAAELLHQRLMVLFTRKSLAHWHREAMIDWAQQLMALAQTFDRETADRMLAFYQQMIAEMSGISLEELQSEWREQLEREEERRQAFEKQAKAFSECYGDMDEDEQVSAFFKDLGIAPEPVDEPYQSPLDLDTYIDTGAGAKADPDVNVVSPQQLMRKLFRQAGRQRKRYIRTGKPMSHARQRDRI